VPLDDLIEEFARRSGNLDDLDEALERLREKDPDLVQLIELRFFAGQSIANCARALGVVERTVERRWDMARRKLRHELGDD
jgi:RNA polymerase sigma factor (sigma-70 family)